MSKKLAIMQPYFFPYIGYFQLIDSVDSFIFYDDVAYIKGGWINRNYIKDNVRFSVPVKKKSSYTNINETFIDWDSFRSDKFIKTLEFSYSNSPNKEEVISIIKNLFRLKPKSIATLASESVILVSRYLDIKTNFRFSSSMSYDKSNKSQTLVNICKSKSADIYINSIGGKELYKKEEFKEKGIELKFLKTQSFSNKEEKSSESFSSLSIIDVLMNCGKEKTQVFLKSYSLI